MALLKIVEVGHPVLRESARALTQDEIRSPDVIRLIEMMRETMRDAPGVGLAAPQVGEALQLAMIEDRPEYQEGLSREDLAARARTPVPFYVIINPRLTIIETRPVEFFEGCLSVPNFMAVVPRAFTVRVDALDHQGRELRVDAQGWHARILQHEIDHLNGSLYVDRMEPRTLTTMREMMRVRD